MLLGERLRALREAKEWTQGEIEKRTGLRCCYVSRVENGYTVPSVENLEKFAVALEIPIYQLFYDDKEPPKLPNSAKGKSTKWGESGRDARTLARFRRLLSKTDPSGQRLLLLMAQKMAQSKVA